MTSFAVTWDYRCPFARLAHLHLLDGLAAGADWDITFLPFSLGQVHVAEGDAPIWDRPDDDSGLLALRAGVVVRDRFPDAFLAVHRELFDARHVHAKHLDEDTVRAALVTNGVDADVVFAEIADGAPLDTVRKEHEAAALDHHVWGVPTFIVGDQAVFVRLTTDSAGDGELARTRIDRILDLATGYPELNEFKHTSIPR
ncbi:MAG TPA: DsbA family protein [Acidimicrobiales bacterium]